MTKTDRIAQLESELAKERVQHARLERRRVAVESSMGGACLAAALVSPLLNNMAITP